jgi:LuxR family maltose regulon positive regulatory protein
VPRPRLLQRLDAGLRGKLTLVSAPAGFGKTTLATEWLSQLSIDNYQAAWLSLDEGDNDLSRFLIYLIAALQTIEAGIGETALAVLQSPQPPPVETVLTSFINDIGAYGGSCVLVLDDYHLITTRAVHDCLAFLLDHLPHQAHLLIATRVDPPLPLARLRARGQMTELRAADLRFTTEESAAFLNHVMGLDLAPEQIARLESRAEGWIAGLQMAALSMKGKEDVDEFIVAFSSSHRHILDYLTEEVINQQPQSIQRFLLQTAVLDHLCGPLCEAVTGREGGQETLENLEEANLFLIPLDDERRWYRYHHLFAELLQSRLEQTQPDQVPALHRQASEWYEENGLIAEAVTHALAAGDVEQVARLVTGNALSMMDRGELTTLVGQLNALPDELVRARPWLCISHSWTLTYTGQLDASEARLQDAENALDGLEGRAEMHRIAGHIDAIRAYVAELRGNNTGAITLARGALEYLPDDDVMTRSFAADILASSLRISGDLEAATQTLAEPVANIRLAGDNHLAIFVLCNLGIIQVMQGQLYTAAATYRNALQLADEYARRSGWQMHAAGYAYARMSTVLREWNDLEAAMSYIRKGLEYSRQWGQADMKFICYDEMAKVRQAMGDGDGAFHAIRDARRIASGLSSWFGILVGALEAQLRLSQGDVAAAASWAKESGLSIDDEISFQHEFMYRTLARLLIAQNQLDEALELLARLLKMIEAVGAMGIVIQILILQALALQTRGESEQAMAALKRALTLAEPEGYVRVFIDEGAPIGELLLKAATQGIAVDYIGKLLAALESETVDAQSTTPPAPSALVDPLSERELEVLRLLTTHLSSTEIAQELFISVNTVRSHIKSIYGKLNVHSRKDAIQRAQELELL